MRAILLSAGRGSRLDPLTRDRPKCLVPIAGATILDHQIRALREIGIDDVTVVIGYRHDMVERHLAEHHGDRRPDTQFNPFWAISSSIGSVWSVRHLLDGPFCLANGDTLYEAALLDDAIGFARAGDGIGLVVEDVDDFGSDDMRVTAQDERITAVGKHLSTENARLRSLGVVICTAPDGGGYPDALRTVIARPNGTDAYHHDVVGFLAASRLVRPLRVRDRFWQEIDTVEDIAKVARHDHLAA